MANLPDLEKMSDEDLVRATATMTRDNPTVVTVEHLLLARSARRQGDAANALVRATEKLATATWVLAVLTVVICATGIVQVYLAYKGIK